MKGKSEAAEGAAGRRAGTLERTVCMSLGSGLVLVGLRRPTLRRIASLLAGGTLVYRAVAGRSVGAGAGVGGKTAAAGAPLVRRTMTVGAPIEGVYSAWRDPHTLPRVMEFLGCLTPKGDDVMHWLVTWPLGVSLSWETRIVEDRPGESIRWESLPGAPFPNAGEVRFSPARNDRGTLVTADVRVAVPGGGVGRMVAARFGVVPDLIADKALRRFRSLVEAGEIPVSSPQPAGR